MRRQKLVKRKEEPGHARQHGRHQKQRGPAVEPLPAEQSEHHHKSREDPDQTQHHVHERECRHSEDHDNPPSRRKNSDDPVEREDTTHFHRGAIFQGGPFPVVWAGSSPSRSPERRTPASRIAPHTLFHLSSFPSPLPHTRVCSNTDTLRDPAPCSR